MKEAKNSSYLNDQSFISKCYRVMLFIIPSEGNNQWSVYVFLDHQKFCNKQDEKTDWLQDFYMQE